MIIFFVINDRSFEVYLFYPVCLFFVFELCICPANFLFKRKCHLRLNVCCTETCGRISEDRKKVLAPAVFISVKATRINIYVSLIQLAK